MLQKHLGQRSMSEDEAKWLNPSATYRHSEEATGKIASSGFQILGYSMQTHQHNSAWELSFSAKGKGKWAHCTGQFVVLFACCHLKELGSWTIQCLEYGFRWNQVLGFVSKLFCKLCCPTVQSLICRSWASLLEVMSFSMPPNLR